MPEVFTVLEEVRIDAPAHGPGYQYRVAVGTERWPEGDDTVRKVRVCKVQMVNPQGQVLGRQAPSYPSLEEWTAIKHAMDSLMARLADKEAPTRTPVRILIQRAAEAMVKNHPDGFTEDELCDFLNQNFPRPDGRTWTQNMVVAGDYAVWSDNGEPCNKSAIDVVPKVLERVSGRSERPKRYRLISGDSGSDEG